MIRFFVLAFATFIFLIPAAQAEEFTDAQRAEIKKMFEEFLLESGETVLTSVTNYQAVLEEKTQAEAEEKAKEFLSNIDGKKLPMVGNAKGDITIVEFFDYNCGYCHRAFQEIQTVLKNDDKVKIIFMDMPILGPSSREASKWALAAQNQGKYFEYHAALMEHNGPKDEANLEKLAEQTGLDVKKLKKDKESKEINDKIDEQITQAQSLNIRGTPGFIINGQIFPGYIPAAQIQEVIKEERES